MAVEAEFFSENMGFSQDWMLIIPKTTPCLPPPVTCDAHHLTFSNTLQQQQQQQQMGMGMEMGMRMGFDVGERNASYPSSFSGVMDISQPFADLLDKHKHEVDLYLHFQGERLKEAVQQHKSQQMELLIKSYESKTKALIREKDKDLEKMRVKTKMLEDYLKKSVGQTEMWQRVAKEKEEMVIGLNNMLLMLHQNNKLITTVKNEDSDAESVCDCESFNRENEEKKMKVNACKWCNKESLCVVFLPCKHLCCCKVCESVLGHCPVCNSVKQGSLEIFFS